MAMAPSENLNIMHIHWGFPPTIGGVETHLTYLLPELVSNGHHVRLLTGAFTGEKVRSEYCGVDVYRTPLLDLNWLVKRGLDGLELDLEKFYADHILTFRPDLVHTHNMHYFSEPHIKILESICASRQIPLMLTAHNVWDDTLFLRLTRDVNWAHIVAVSDYIRMELRGVGVHPSRTTTIHHGIALNDYPLNKDCASVFKKYPQLENKKIVFHPARMGLAKGCDVTIKAMRVVADQIPDAMLVLAGSKNIIDWEISQERDIAYIVDLIRALGLTERALIDVFPLEFMPDMYRVSDVVVYPSSVAEPFGLAMLEAFASARPIIVTYMGGMPEVVQNDISGYVVHQKDFEALADRIVSLLRDERLLEGIGNAGRRIIEQQYTKEIMTQEHLRVYSQVLDQAGRLLAHEEGGTPKGLEEGPLGRPGTIPAALRDVDRPEIN
jgi:glycosyltransferase involved in cell wall biosynthesis